MTYSHPLPLMSNILKPMTYSKVKPPSNEYLHVCLSAKPKLELDNNKPKKTSVSQRLKWPIQHLLGSTALSTEN